MGSATPLWILFRGAPARIAAGWMAWMGGVGVAAALAAPFVPAGTVAMVALGVGWWLGRVLGSPLDALRRYHLDDTEITVLGPGAQVRRLAWTDVLGLTQRRDALRLEGATTNVTMPLATEDARQAWGAVLTRVVPDLAADLWLRLEDGEERLVPTLDPATPVLVWWSWIPAAGALALGSDLPAVMLVALVAATERGVAWLLARRQTVTMHPTGVSLRSADGRRFVAWNDAIVTPVPDGLRVGPVGRDSACIGTSAPNFWPAAAAMVLRAQIGPICPGPVTFRVRIDDGGLSVVGEIDTVN